MIFFKTSFPYYSNSFLKFGTSESSSRSNSGRKSLYSCGTYKIKRVYKFILFDFNSSAIVSDYFRILKFEFDSFRNNSLALVYSPRTLKFVYVTAPVDLYLSNNVCINGARTSTGDISFMSNAAIGYNVFNVGSSSRFSQAIYSRSASSSSLVVSKGRDSTYIKLPSGKVKKVFDRASCSFGIPAFSNKYNKNRVKFGGLRNFGHSIKVRGVAKNPIDHPHGGGEGRKSPPASARSPWGWLTKP